MSNLVPWQPFLDLTTALDRMFEDAVPPTRVNVLNALRAFPVDVFETIQSYRLEAAIPGVKPEDLHVTATRNTITIRAITQEAQEQSEGSYLRRERYRGEMQRVIALPLEIIPASVTSAYEHGVLTIYVPKTEDAKPKEVAVKVKMAK
jgi:HSP20 family protein